MKLIASKLEAEKNHIRFQLTFGKEFAMTCLFLFSSDEQKSSKRILFMICESGVSFRSELEMPTKQRPNYVDDFQTSFHYDSL